MEKGWKYVWWLPIVDSLSENILDVRCDARVQLTHVIPRGGDTELIKAFPLTQW